MQRTFMQTEATRPIQKPQPALQVLLSQSEDEFYGSLQRIWNNVVQLEDMGIIQREQDKFMYAYRFAEAELQRAYTDKECIGMTSQRL